MCHCILYYSTFTTNVILFTLSHLAHIRSTLFRTNIRSFRKSVQKEKNSDVLPASQLFPSGNVLKRLKFLLPGRPTITTSAHRRLNGITAKCYSVNSENASAEIFKTRKRNIYALFVQ